MQSVTHCLPGIPAQKTTLDVPCRNVTERVREVTMCIAPITHCPRPLGAKKNRPRYSQDGAPRAVFICIYMIPAKSRYHINHTKRRPISEEAVKTFQCIFAPGFPGQMAGTENSGHVDPALPKEGNRAWVRGRPADSRCTNRVFLCIMELDLPGGLFRYVPYYSRLLTFFN